MNSFMSWVGGKKALRDAIVARLDERCDRYVEVFGGGGWVLFHKRPSKFEVYNDFNGTLVNLYRCVRDHPDELCEELRYSLNSRRDFDYIRDLLHSDTRIPDIKRAAFFYQVIRESYASGLDSFGGQPHNIWNNFPIIHKASERLQTVVIENKDFEKLIAQYDRPNTILDVALEEFKTLQARRSSLLSAEADRTIRVSRCRNRYGESDRVNSGKSNPRSGEEFYQ